MDETGIIPASEKLNAFITSSLLFSMDGSRYISFRQYKLAESWRFGVTASETEKVYRFIDGGVSYPKKTFMHTQTMDICKATFPPPTWPGYEANYHYHLLYFYHIGYDGTIYMQLTRNDHCTVSF